MKEDLERSLEVLKKGAVILYPTDTVWGLGCDATNSLAIDKIYRIKEREPGKSMLVLIDRIARLNHYVKIIPEDIKGVIESAGKPLTIIYPRAKNLAGNLVAPDGSIGIRIVQDEFCKQLIGRFTKPIVSTSANLSGKPAPANFGEIDPFIAGSVDYVVKWRQDDTRKLAPSGIIRLALNGDIEVIRK